MPTRWIHGGVIPPCPCGATSEDQVRRTSGADRAYWFCLACERRREPEPSWHDDLIPLTETEWRARSRAMEHRARNRRSKSQS